MTELRLVPPRHVVTRPIPLYDEHGALVRVVKPGTGAIVVVAFDATGPTNSRNRRAMVRFDDDPARDAWDVSADSIAEAE